MVVDESISLQFWLKKYFCFFQMRMYFFLSLYKYILQNCSGNKFFLPINALIQSASVQAPAPFKTKTPVNGITCVRTSHRAGFLFGLKHCHWNPVSEMRKPSNRDQRSNFFFFWFLVFLLALKFRPWPFPYFPRHPKVDQLRLAAKPHQNAHCC